MTQDDNENQIARFIRIKNNPNSFEQEMIEAELNEEQRISLHKYLDKFNGCAVIQESFMQLV
jgi:DNA polymerase III alpha subunit